MTTEEVKKLAELARIKLTDEEKKRFSEELSSILSYVSEVNDIVGNTVEKKEGALFNVMREDINPHESGLYTEALLSLAPKRKGQFFEVKKTLIDS